MSFSYFYQLELWHWSSGWVVYVHKHCSILRLNLISLLLSIVSVSLIELDHLISHSLGKFPEGER